MTPRFRAYVYDYDPITGISTTLGIGVFDALSATILDIATPTPISVDLTGKTLTAGHRLRWRFTAQNISNLPASAITLEYDSTIRPSRSNYCEKAPGTIITDTLPSGITFQSATLNGNPVAPLGNSGQSYNFLVNSTDTTDPGQVTAGQAGVLVVIGTVNTTQSAGTSSFVNQAKLNASDTTCETFYFSRNFKNVGSAGIQNIASRSSPTGLYRRWRRCLRLNCCLARAKRR